MKDDERLKLDITADTAKRTQTDFSKLSDLFYRMYNASRFYLSKPLVLGGGIIVQGGPLIFRYASNYQATESGANNAIAINLVDAQGNAVTPTAGLEVKIVLAHTLQAGANTLATNGGSALNIKSHRNPANNIGTAYAVGGIIHLMFDGTQWQDMSQ